MNQSKIWIMILVITVVGFTFYNIDGWLVEDDEGTALYAAWRYAEGEQPYADFTTTNPPLFLLIGKTAIEFAGRDIFFLRAISAVSILFSVTILAWSIKAVWGTRVAILVWGFTLLSPSIYHLARIFRADSLMLSFIFLALALMVGYIARPRYQLLIGAGVIFGLALLTKVLAVMPLIGAMLWLLIQAIQTKQWRAWIINSLTLGLPAIIIVVSGYALTEAYMPGALTMIMGAQSETLYSTLISTRLLKGLIGWLALGLSNPFIFLAFPILLSIAIRWRNDRHQMFWVAQALGGLLVFMISGPVYPRYLVYVIPGLIMLALIRINPDRYVWLDTQRPVFLLSGLLIPLLFALPHHGLLSRQETGTQALADWISDRTEPGAVVVSDYAELAFHAGRRSIPIQAGIGGGWALTGLITGEIIREQMETENAVMLLLHVEGGNPPPHQLVAMSDYELFRIYLQEEYRLLTIFDRAGQLIEVYVKQE